MESNYSLSDIAALTDGNGFGNSTLLIVLFLLIFAGNGFGNRMGELGQYATAASQQEILFGQQFQNLGASINKVGDGLASLGYAQSNQISNEARAIQTQISDCCCSNKEAIAQVRYDMANFNAQTNATIHAEAEATRNMLQQNKIESLQGRVNQLELQSAMSGVVRYPNALNYNAGGSPFCNNSCGCNAI